MVAPSNTDLQFEKNRDLREPSPGFDKHRTVTKKSKHLIPDLDLNQIELSIGESGMASPKDIIPKKFWQKGGKGNSVQIARPHNIDHSKPSSIQSRIEKRVSD